MNFPFAKKLNRINPQLTRVLTAYIVFAIIEFILYRFLITTDAVSYIVTARKFIHGEYLAAVTGVWSPMLPILIIPLMLVGIAGHQAISFVLFLASGLLIIALAKYFNSLNIAPIIKSLLLWAILPLVLYFPNYGMQPDLLLMTLFFFYLTLILSPRYLENWKVPVFVGIIGSLMYFTKSIGLPLFVVHLFCSSLLLGITATSSQERRRLVLSFLLATLTFCILASLWIVPLSLKYGHITTGLSSTYNTYLVGPHSLGHPGGHPIHRVGFIAPSSSRYAISAWDDPADLIQYMIPWHPFNSLADIKFLLKNVVKNFFASIQIFKSMSIFSTIILLVFFVQVFVGLFRFSRRSVVQYLIPGLTIFLWVMPYFPLHVEERFYWNVYVLLIAILAQQLTCIFELLWPKSLKLLAWTFMLIAITFWGIPQERLLHLDGARNDIFEMSHTLAKVVPAHSNVASNDHWHDMLYLSYCLNWRYYGEQKKNEEDKALLEELQSLGINYFFWWGSNPLPLCLQKYKILYSSKIPAKILVLK